MKFPATLWAIFDDPASATRAVSDVEHSSAFAIAEVLPDSRSLSNRLLSVADTSESMDGDVQSQYYGAVGDGAALVAVDLIKTHQAVLAILKKYGGRTMHWQEFSVPSESRLDLPEDWGTRCRRCDRGRPGWLRRLWSFDWFDCPHCERRYCRSCFRALELVYVRDDSTSWTRACLECDGEIHEWPESWWRPLNYRDPSFWG